METLWNLTTALETPLAPLFARLAHGSHSFFAGK